MKPCQLLFKNTNKFLKDFYSVRLYFYLCRNDLDFAGLNHAIFNWPKNYTSTNQNDLHDTFL